MPHDMNASELDRYITAEAAFTEAIDAGKSEDEAIELARDAVAAKRREQMSRRLGLNLDAENLGLDGDAK